jgi:prevent-host-death family protein
MNKTSWITATDLLKKRGEILRRCYVDKQHFIIANHGLPIAVLIPFDEYQFAKTKTEQDDRSG